MLASVLLSGLISTLISCLFYFYHDKNKEKRKIQLDVLRDIMGYRYAIASSVVSDPTVNEARIRFLSALNQVIVVFGDCKGVMDALIKFKNDPNNYNIITLIREMSKNVGIKYSMLNDSSIQEPFIVHNKVIPPDRKD